MEANDKIFNEVLARVCAVQTEVADLHRRMNDQEETKNDVFVIKVLKEKVWKPKLEKHDKEIEELRKENERLRATIEVIKGYVCNGDHYRL